MNQPKKYAQSPEEIEVPRPPQVQKILDHFVGGPEDVDRELALEDHGGLEFKELCEVQLKELYECHVNAEKWKTLEEELKAKLKTNVGKERGHIMRGNYAVEVTERKQGGGIDYKAAYETLLNFLSGQISDTGKREAQKLVESKHLKPEGVSIVVKPYKLGGK